MRWFYKWQHKCIFAILMHSPEVNNNGTKKFPSYYQRWRIIEVALWDSIVNAGKRHTQDKVSPDSLATGSIQSQQCHRSCYPCFTFDPLIFVCLVKGLGGFKPSYRGCTIQCTWPRLQKLSSLYHYISVALCCVPHRPLISCDRLASI